MPPSDLRFFTQDWTITISTHPHLKFLRQTPLKISDKLKIFMNPANDVLGEHQKWDEAQIQEKKQQALKRYQDAKTLHNALEVLVELDGEIVGFGGAYYVELPIPERLANIGISLNPEARGKGVGKKTMEVLLRLSNELDVDVVHAGTMKANTSMRALAKSLGLVETEKILKVPGRGVVAEILYDDIHQERWKDLDIVVDFKGPAPE